MQKAVSVEVLGQDPWAEMLSFKVFYLQRVWFQRVLFFFYNLNMDAHKCSLSYHFKHQMCVLTKFFLCHVYLYTFYIQKWNNIKSGIKSDIVLDNISSTL